MVDILKGKISKKVKTNFFTKLTLRGKRGISLIVLVITVIVIIIIASAVILSLSNNNPISSANEASFKSSLEAIKSEFSLYVINNVTKVNGDESKFDIKNLNLSGEELYASIPSSKSSNLKDKIQVKYGRLALRENSNVSEKEKEWFSEIIDGSIYGELVGDGSENQPYLISSIEDLVIFSNNVAFGNKYTGKYIKLERNLDFSEDASYINPKNINFCGYNGELKNMLTSMTGFKPIGKGYERKGSGFEGVFLGNNKKIKNLYINEKVESGSYLFFGLFATNIGIIRDLTCENVNINIEVINGNTLVGGITALCAEKGIVENCMSTGSIKINGDTKSYISIAGISGQTNRGDCVISNCVNKTNININMQGNGNIFTGGIIGSANLCNVKNSYNVGNISSYTNGNTNYNTIGGIVGYCPGSIENTYNIGNISGSQNNSNQMAGNICGGISLETNINNSYYINNSLGGTSNVEQNDKSEYKTIEEMKSIGILTKLGAKFKKDINNINDGYPILIWQ